MKDHSKDNTHVEETISWEFANKKAILVIAAGCASCTVMVGGERNITSLWEEV
jgi:hypothetical protein